MKSSVFITSTGCLMRTHKAASYEELSKIYPLPERERKIFYLYTYREVGGDYPQELLR